ncbi:hypothetical protein QWO29_003883 [Escherichia coli]|nr:hypothetical protein [Escherichia coli]
MASVSISCPSCSATDGVVGDAANLLI